MSSEIPSPSMPEAPAAPQGRLPEGWSPPAFCDCISWSGVLGNFLLGFGTLDYLVTFFLKSRLSEREFGKLRERGFTERLDRMAEMIRKSTADPEEINRFDGLTRRVDAVRDVRNHVAHAHLYGTTNPATGEPVITLFTAKDADMGLFLEARHVTFKELVQANNDLLDLLPIFQALAGYEGQFEIELP